MKVKRRKTSQHALTQIILNNSEFDLKIKEALHINRKKPNFIAQQNHSVLTLSL